MEGIGIGISLIRSLTSTIPQLLIVVACIYYLSKNVSIESILLSIGAFIKLLISIFYGYVVPMLYDGDYGNLISGDYYIMNLIGLINIAGSFAFAIGLFLAIHKLVKET